MIMHIPQVGSRVRVTTRYRNYYIYTAKEQPFVEYIYEGTVLPSEKFDKPGTFNITGDERMRSRNIALTSVVSMDYLSGKSTKSAIRAFLIKSGDKSYLVTADGRNYECNCVGFQYRHKCKHVDAVKEKTK